MQLNVYLSPKTQIMESNYKPEQILLTIDDFHHSDWKQAVENAGKTGYHGLYKSFLDASKQALEDEDLTKAKCLALLSDACSMIIRPEKINEPFKPLIVVNGRRTAMPEDFQENDIAFFLLIVEEIDNYWLKARIADLVWLLFKPRQKKHALLAIDAYIEFPLDEDTMVNEGRETWERAIYLCRVLRKDAWERIIEIENAVSEALKKSDIKNGFLAAWLAELLKLTNYSEPIIVAQKAEQIARDADASNEFYRSQEYFKLAGEWFKRAEDKTKSAEMMILTAEMLIKQAGARIESSSSPSHMVGGHFFEKAIQFYRAIPKKERDTYNVDKRIRFLEKQLAESGKVALDEMGVVSTAPIDITMFVESARESVRDKSQLESLKALGGIHPGFNVDQLRELAEKLIRENPLMSLFSSSHYSSDGRIVAKNPGIDLSDLSSERNEKAIFSEIVRNYLWEIGFVVSGRIIPALQVLQLQHRFSEGDFIEICNRSPIIPQGRELLFGRAIFAGFENDFSMALHLLVPQVENLVRYQLKLNGAKTTNIDRDGIENENGLSTLVDLPEMNQVFGKNLTFEIKSLFCTAMGPNLRNQLAHGLLSPEACESYYSIYAWWFWMKIILATVLNNQKES